jgi:hypothetical protein
MYQKIQNYIEPKKLPKKSPILSITLDYPESKMFGLPFPVSMEEIKSLYHSYIHIDGLVHNDELAPTTRKCFFVNDPEMLQNCEE